MKCVSDIVYDPDNGLAFDLFLPDNLKADACILFAHGGGFRRGSRETPEAGHFADRLTREGFAVASVSYRLRTGLDAFDDEDRPNIEAYMARSKKVGLSLSPNLYGPEFIAAMEDLSKAIEYLWVEGMGLGIASRKVGVLGVSAGGIAGLALAYPPMQWTRRVSKPDAVVAISSAIVQPWRLEEDGPTCLMLHGPQDRIIDLGNAQLGAARAEQVKAPVKLINTGVKGHMTQVDAALDGSYEDGTPYMQMIIDQFARLRDD
jgi:acetyl esterase/lipase